MWHKPLCDSAAQFSTDRGAGVQQRAFVPPRKSASMVSCAQQFPPERSSGYARIRGRRRSRSITNDVNSTYLRILLPSSPVLDYTIAGFVRYIGQEIKRLSNSEIGKRWAPSPEQFLFDEKGLDGDWQTSISDDCRNGSIPSLG